MYLYRYKTIVDRILKARLVYESPNMNRAVSFEYMNRQLVWNEFSVNLFLAALLLSNNQLVPNKSLVYAVINFTV